MLTVKTAKGDRPVVFRVCFEADCVPELRAAAKADPQVIRDVIAETLRQLPEAISLLLVADEPAVREAMREMVGAV